MNHNRQVARLLDDEHRSLLDLLGQVEQALGRARHHDAALAPLLGLLARSIEHDMQRHFLFEEESLFPLLIDAGDGGIAALLTDEHDAMREVGDELMPLLRDATAGRLDDAPWAALRRLAQEFVEREVAHIQKESMALLPMLEDLLDADTDAELALAYSAQ
jgi:hemerythrin-like domain-containing protein